MLCGKKYTWLIILSLNFLCFFNFNFTPIFSRDVYHCPFCNLCRVGRGLGIDYFHCMKCNCCLGMKSESHKCLEKGLEMNCPICCDDLFTSSATVRALPCGHYMHSACFQVYFIPILDFNPISKQVEMGCGFYLTLCYVMLGIHL